MSHRRAGTADELEDLTVEPLEGAVVVAEGVVAQQELHEIAVGVRLQLDLDISMKSDVIWIAGGIDKGNDYSELSAVAKQKVKAIVCLGKDNHKILEAFGDTVPTIVETTSMEEAVRSSYYLAHKGDTVLLSPACASFDLFNNYEDRGRQFKLAVRNL